MPSHVNLGELTKIRTGKLDANASSHDGEFPFFTCASEPLKIASFSYDCECVLVAGNGDLNVKYYSGKFDAYQRTYIIESINSERLNTKYLYHFMGSYLCTLREQSIGGIIKYIKIGNLTDAKIPLPSLSEQRRIAAILDKADALRAKRRETIAKLDQLLQSVFLEMFGDPATNPKGWPTGVIGDMLESAKYGSSEKADVHGDVPILRMNNLTYTGEMNLTDLKYIASDKAEEKYTVRPGDILFNRTNSKELVGKTAVYEGPTPMAYAGYLVRARTLPKHAPEYISAFLNSVWGKSTLRAMCKNIVGMANINAREFQGVEIPIPPSELQFEFREQVMSIRAQKKKLEGHLLTMDRLFSSLQHQAFSGTL